jgi:acyl dehydratase
MATPSYEETQAGTEIPPRQYQVTRGNLVRYAGASGDFNVIHWNERVAKSVGLPNVIAHGMYTMAQAGRYVTDLAGGDPGAVEEFGVRFSSMVVVPDDDDGATIEITGTVAEVRDDGRAVIDVVARQNGTKVLSRARAIIRVP